MGAWTPGIFGNDNALDLLTQLERGAASSLLHETITTFLQSNKPKTPLEERALAAAAIMAAAASQPPHGVTPAARKWIETSAYVPDRNDLKLAHQAAKKITTASEVHDLWKESGDLKTWKAGVLKLIASLADAQKCKLPQREPKQPSVPKLLYKQLDLYQRDPNPKLKAAIQKKIASLTTLNDLSADTGICLPLVLLIKHKFFAEAKSLIEKGADPTLVEPRYGGPPALLLACASGDLDLVKFIFSRGVSVFSYIALDPATQSLLQFNSAAHFPAGVTPQRYSPPLMTAFRHGHVDIASHLIQLGANAREDCLGETILHRAVQSGDLKAVRFALEQKPDINSASRVGETALHLVIKAGKDKCAIARELINAGADPDRADKFKMTLLDQAIDLGDTELVNCLRAMRPTRSTPN